MKTIENIRECNDKLFKAKGFNAKIWRFNNTFGQLIIRVWNFTENKVESEFFIVVLGCEYIKGPFLWKNSNIIISLVENDINANENYYKLTDKGSYFELIASGGILLIWDVELDENGDFIQPVGVNND